MGLTRDEGRRRVIRGKRTSVGVASIGLPASPFCAVGLVTISVL